MYAKNCTKTDLENAAGLRWRISKIEDRGSKGLMFTLRHFNASNAKEFQGMNRTPNIDGSPGRRTSSLCIHAHYEFFVRLFDINPNAEIHSNWYGKIIHTRTTLHDNYEKMRYKTIRMYDNLLLDDCCNCPEEVKP